ncbi:MAG: hypothetical protein AB7G48_06375 [Nitrospiraceae bacterium]
MGNGYAPLLLPHSFAAQLLRCYEYPDPRRRGRVIRGYDRPHALRTARLCGAVALSLGYGRATVRQYQIACLLHDLGRAGLDRNLFGRIWSWAQRRGIPTRPREWRARYPITAYGSETEAFISRFGRRLERDGISMDAWAREQVEMRLGYGRRLSRRLRAVRPFLVRLGVRWESWMHRIMLYYYYPERLNGVPRWVKQLAEVLVACEQFEAYSNRQRGRDYYGRHSESLEAAVRYLEQLEAEGILSAPVLSALKQLAAAGSFDHLLASARGSGVTARERRFLRRSAREGITWP